MTITTDRVRRLVAELTIDEKAALTAGDDAWHLPGIARIGLGRMMLSDGPSGVRGAQFGTIRSLSYPCGMAVGATWDRDLATRFGGAVAEEARAKAVHVVLGPTVCIPRTPLGGRTFESFSEDPFLTAELTVAYVDATQAAGVGCCVKHFACNDQEHERMTIDAVVDEVTLREVHLAPFEAAVRRAGVWAVMSAYNKLNGHWCAENPDLLDTILRGEWGFDGVVISDWGGTHSTVGSIDAGLDVEMPAPARFLGGHLAEAVRTSTVDGEALDDRAERILTLAERTGLLDEATPRVEAEEDAPHRRALAREIATSSMVLLTNDGTLPLQTDRPTKIALIGPNATHPEGRGGGSSTVTAFTEPGLAAALAERLPFAEITTEPGCRLDAGLPPIPRWLFSDGMTIDYFTEPDCAGEVAASSTAWESRFIMMGAPHPDLPAPRSVRARMHFTPDTDGRWMLGVVNTSPTRVFIDGSEVIDNTAFELGRAFFGHGSRLAKCGLDVVAGETRVIEVEMAITPGLLVGGFELYAAPPDPGDPLPAALTAARAADIAVVVVGSNGRLETEGADRTSLSLPGAQDDLVARVVEANPRTIVVVNTGAPVTMPWADGAAAVLMTWYPGEEGVNALVDVLTGAADPGGRLPITFPARIEDSASHGFYPGDGSQVVYGEGLDIGHRHFDSKGIEPVFAFGHGLSYTTFALGEPSVDGAGTDLTITVPVTNTGERSGSTVVQCYVARTDNRPNRPLRQLEGFAKLALDAGATRDAVISLDDRSFARWDVDTHSWMVDPSRYQLHVGTSSRAIDHIVDVEIP